MRSDKCALHETNRHSIVHLPRRCCFARQCFRPSKLSTRVSLTNAVVLPPHKPIPDRVVSQEYRSYQSAEGLYREGLLQLLHAKIPSTLLLF